MWASTREVSFIPAIAGYLAFTAATLLAVSLPALGAWLYIDAVGWVGPEPASRLVRQAVIALGLACSAAGFMTTIWSFSRLAALAIVLEVAVLYLAISGLSFLREDPDPR